MVDGISENFHAWVSAQNEVNEKCDRIQEIARMVAHNNILVDMSKWEGWEIRYFNDCLNRFGGRKVSRK